MPNKVQQMTEAETKALAIGVAQGWLAQEAHIDGTDQQLAWATEAQKELIEVAEKLRKKYLARHR